MLGPSVDIILKKRCISLYNGHFFLKRVLQFQFFSKDTEGADLVIQQHATKISRFYKYRGVPKLHRSISYVVWEVHQYIIISRELFYKSVGSKFCRVLQISQPYVFQCTCRMSQVMNNLMLNIIVMVYINCIRKFNDFKLVNPNPLLRVGRSHHHFPLIVNRGAMYEFQ